MNQYDSVWLRHTLKLLLQLYKSYFTHVLLHHTFFIYQEISNPQKLLADNELLNKCNINNDGKDCSAGWMGWHNIPASMNSIFLLLYHSY